MQDYVQINNYANINNKTTQGFFALKRFFERKLCTRISSKINMQDYEYEVCNWVSSHKTYNFFTQSYDWSDQHFVSLCKFQHVLEFQSCHCPVVLKSHRKGTKLRLSNEREGGGHATHLFHRGLFPIEKNMIVVHIHVTYM